jgi:hypothetical protein
LQPIIVCDLADDVADNAAKIGLELAQSLLSPTLPIGAVEHDFRRAPARKCESDQRRLIANRL